MVSWSRQDQPKKSSPIKHRQFLSNSNSPRIPFVLADMQSANGMDTAIVGMSDLSVTKAGNSHTGRSSSRQYEINHPAEIGGYLAVTPTIRKKTATMTV